MAAPRIPIPDLPEHTTPVDSDLLVVQNGATTKKMTMARLSSQVAAPLADHLADTSDAHDASAVSALPNSAPMAGTDVQSQLNQAASGLSTLTTNLDTHKTAPNAHTASNIAFTPVGTIAATNVQAAIAEVAAEGGTGGGGGTNEVWIGPEEPTDPAVELWYDTDATSEAAAATQTIETVAGTTYTVVAADANKIKRLTATATITLPMGGPALGQRVDFVCIGGPAWFILEPLASWDVPPTPSAVARAVGSFVTAIKMTSTAWALTGDLA